MPDDAAPAVVGPEQIAALVAVREDLRRHVDTLADQQPWDNRAMFGRVLAALVDNLPAGWPPPPAEPHVHFMVRDAVPESARTFGGGTAVFACDPVGVIVGSPPMSQRTIHADRATCPDCLRAIARMPVTTLTFSWEDRRP